MKNQTEKKIAVWKIKSEEERRLALLADNDEEHKKEYVDFYRENDPQYYEKGLPMLQSIIDLHRQNLLPEQRSKYIIDMIYSLHRFGCMFNEYFMFGFENLNVQGRETFITDKIRWDYYPIMNSNEAIVLFDNKMDTYNLLQGFFKRDLVRIETENDIIDFRSFIQKHRDFVVKPLLGSGGRGISVYRNVSNTDETFYRIIRDGPVIVEEYIEQSADLASFHRSSVNTVRLPTVQTRDEIIIFHPIFRTGCGSSVTDNTTGGGIFAPIDPITGIIYGTGLSRNGKTYILHPDSKTIFPGFQLPEWDEAIQLVKDAALLCPEAHYVGWDIAHTDNGWVLIEGNAQAEFVGWQSTSRRGVRNELDQYILKMS